MKLVALITITLICIAWSLWIRRVTWTSRWEIAATLNIALQGCAVALMCPLASATVGHWLHALTGEWNIEDWIGHDCYIVAASAIVYNAVGRLDDDAALQAKFKRDVEYPATLCIPLLLATFSMGHGATIYRADFFDVPTDFWLDVYWLLLCGTLGYLLVYGSRALFILRRDPASRRFATLYLAASTSGLLACASRILISFAPPWQTPTASLVVWVFCCGCGGGFALISAQSWRIKMRWFTPKDSVSP